MTLGLENNLKLELENDFADADTGGPRRSPLRRPSIPPRRHQPREMMAHSLPTSPTQQPPHRVSPRAPVASESRKRFHARCLERMKEARSKTVARRRSGINVNEIENAEWTEEELEVRFLRRRGWDRGFSRRFVHRSYGGSWPLKQSS